MSSKIAQSIGVLLLSNAFVSFAAGPARAQDTSKTAARLEAEALFSDARKLIAARDYEHACPKFEQSLRLNVGIGVQFNLADCWEHIGRSASAYALFLGTAASARTVGQVEREQVARARAVALEPRLLRMLIDVRAADKELIVRRNRIVVEHPSWGTAGPVDPGTYLIEATAPGKKPWSTMVTILATATDTLSIVVPPLADECACDGAAAGRPRDVAAKQQLATSADARHDSDSPPILADEPAPRSKRRITYTVALTSLGVAALGLGTFFALESRSKNHSAQQICPSSTNCTRAEIYNHGAYLDDAKTYRTWSFVGFGVGGSALIGAAVLHFAPRSSTASASGFRALPFVSADGSWGATALGSF